jgi:phosphoglycerate dehydrogenase-like enzyme
VGAILVTKDQLFREADILIIHLVLVDATRGLVGANELAQMKPIAWLVNTSHGAIADEGALVQALKGKKLAGAARDVFEVEPLPADHPSGRLATPHLG